MHIVHAALDGGAVWPGCCADATCSFACPHAKSVASCLPAYLAAAEEQEGEVEGEQFAALNTRTLGVLLATLGSHVEAVLGCAGHAVHVPCMLWWWGLGLQLGAASTHRGSCFHPNRRGYFQPRCPSIQLPLYTPTPPSLLMYSNLEWAFGKLRAMAAAARQLEPGSAQVGPGIFPQCYGGGVRVQGAG